MPQVALVWAGEAIGAELLGGTLGSVIGGALGGGIGSAATGGDFWKGAISGGISSGLGSTDWLGAGDAMRGALGGTGLDSAASGIAMNALRGGVTSSLGGGNFLTGAATGALMPTVISGAKNALTGWGGATGGLDSGGWGRSLDDVGMLDAQAASMPSWSAPDGATQQAMLDAQVSGMNVGNPGGNFLSKAVNNLFSPQGGGKSGNTMPGNTMLASLLNSGTNLYMNQQNAKAAEKYAGMADPYQGYRSGDAAAYNDLLKNPAGIFNDPMYKAMAQQGDEALMRQAAAMGGIDSGALTSRISQQRMALADAFLQNRLNQLGAGGGVGANPGAPAAAYSSIKNPNYLYQAMMNPVQTHAYTGRYA